MDITAAREAYEQARANTERLESEYKQQYEAQQLSQSDPRLLPSERMDIQHRVGQAHEAVQQSKAVLATSAAKCFAFEKARMQQQQRELQREYHATARLLTLQLARLMDLDTRMGHPIARCLGVGRFAVPAFNNQPQDDTGCLVGTGFCALTDVAAEARRLNDALETVEV